MADRFSGRRRYRVLAVAALALAGLGHPPATLAADYSGHPAVGSWYGKAIQLCPAGVAPSSCSGGQPAVTLLMTPTLTGEGLFVADDSLLWVGVPFAPHTTAHGQWYPTSSSDFIADYIFMLGPFPPVPYLAVSGFRARWQAHVVDANTIVGYVNGYATPPVPLSWQPLAENEFPTFPPEAADIITPKNNFVTDPATCKSQGCPLVFKFTLKRVAP